jgi:hypothetical protein
MNPEISRIGHEGLSMIRRILLLATMVVVIFAGTLPALADKRIALIVGNANYENVKRLENPRNDAMLMATTLREHAGRRRPTARSGQGRNCFRDRSNASLS